MQWVFGNGCSAETKINRSSQNNNRNNPREGKFPDAKTVAPNCPFWALWEVLDSAWL
jgi:hypothetical protein